MSAATMRTLFREYTNEPDTTRVPDSVVDIYLESGLEATNRRVGYHWTTDSTSIVLAAGTQEYVTPSNCVLIQWVEWNGKLLQKSDVEQWRRDKRDWRNEPLGAPLEWAHYGNMLVFRPAPSAEAVAVAPSPIVRYNSTPPALAASGPEQLSTQDERIPVFWSVAEWSFAQPGASEVSIERGKAFMELFDSEIEKVAKEYEARRISR